MLYWILIILLIIGLFLLLLGVITNKGWLKIASIIPLILVIPQSLNIFFAWVKSLWN